ncbi:DUF4139 domain-containing protein [Allosphingosinicella flava]|nr:hypothetical protein [Sphingosinicella flava]
MRRFIPLLLAVLSPSPLAAQATATSSAPEKVAVTVYRDPNRSAQTAINMGWLNGFALVTETRRIAIPAGDATIRFEGVAGGIIPESAIVTGLPDGVAEKNRDALLLSPASLIDRSLGRRVHLKRTSATGEVREEEAVIRSSASGAVVLQTPEGVEALRCTGLPETLIYDKVPEGLSAKPTLSVMTRSDAAREATITLSYLAAGFDWQANYVATLSPYGDRMDLFAWVTLASTDETSFPAAETSTVAGKLERRSYARPKPRGEPLNLQCWPSGTTSDIDADERDMPPPPPPPPPPAPPPPVMARPEAITVTGSRMMAQQEELGDLKLYRIPEPVTVAARGQKQVALLEKPDVKVNRIHRQWIDPLRPQDSAIEGLISTRNRVDAGLGIALPAGKILFFSEENGRRMLIGEGHIDDKAVGEDVDITLNLGPALRMQAREVSSAKGMVEYELTVTNDAPHGARYEALFDRDDVRIVPVSTRLARRDGAMVWATEVPANGSRTFRYKVKRL